MDQELVQYLEEKFQMQEQRFQALLDPHFGQVDQRFASIDQRFASIDRRFEETSEHFVSIDDRFNSIDERFVSIDERFVSIDGRFDELKRHTGVLVEGLRHEVQLVAEGFAVFVEGRYAQDQANIDRQFRETHALIRTSYVHLQQQHDQLTQRVDNLERKPPT
jgi:hypothetical protein